MRKHKTQKLFTIPGQLLTGGYPRVFCGITVLCANWVNTKLLANTKQL